jgi:hypothetical protein
MLMWMFCVRRQIFAAMTDEQMRRYECFRRSGLSRPNLKRVSPLYLRSSREPQDRASLVQSLHEELSSRLMQQFAGFVVLQLSKDGGGLSERSH